MAERWTAYMRLDELKRANRNPKGHDASGIAASLKRFGYVEAITLDERTSRLVAGHGRLDELEDKRGVGESPPEGLKVDEDGMWLVPVQRGWESVDDDEAEAYLLTSNHLVEKGGWEPTGLAEILESLMAGPGLDGTGYLPHDLEDLLHTLSPPSLDDLRRSLGDEPTEEEMWPLVRLKLAPSTRDELLSALGEDGTDDERVRKLLARLA